MLTNYGGKYHAKERWAEYVRTVKQARAEGKDAHEIGGMLKHMAVQWFRQEEKEREVRREQRENVLREMRLWLKWARHRVSPTEEPRPERATVDQSSTPFEFPESLLLQADNLKVNPMEIVSMNFQMTQLAKAYGELPKDEWAGWVS